MSITAEDILGALAARSRSLEVGQMTETRRTRTRRRKNRDEDPVNDTAKGRETRTGRPNCYTDVVVDAVQGMPTKQYDALLVAIQAHQAPRSRVTARLHTVVERSIERDGFWPEKIRRRPCGCGRLPAETYHPDLIELAIRELEDPRSYGTQRQRAEWFGLSEPHWKKIMRDPYGVVWNQLSAWYEAGVDHIQRRLKRRGHFKGEN